MAHVRRVTAGSAGVVEWKRIRMAKGKGVHRLWEPLGIWLRRNVCAQLDHLVFDTPG